MVKKVLSFLLAVVLVFGLCAPAVPQASAAQNLTASDNCVELIKEFEGFLPKPQYDYSQYSVGYGSACDKDDYPNGITREEAERLLRRDLAKIEPKINQFATSNGITLSQQQFDALASFTYNVGPNWMNDSSGTFHQAVKKGSAGNDLIFAITQWSNAGGSVLDGLARRRLAEANLYLNGLYAKNPPSTYRYVLFNNNMDGAVSTIKIQGYDSSVPCSLRAAPTKSGYRFEGWYTQPEGGTCVTAADANTPQTLYAHWQSVNSEPEEPGQAVDLKVMVTASNVNIRTGPGTGYGKNGQTQKGQYVQLTRVHEAGGELWGKFTKGWIRLDFTDYEVVLLENSPEADKVTAIGIVNTKNLKIRQRPTTASDQVGTYSKGERVNVTLQLLPAGWGKTSRGWVFLDYLDLTPVTEQTPPETTEPPTEEPTEAPTEAPTEVPTEAPTEAPTEPKNEVIATGRITGCDSLRIRAGASTKYKQVGSLTAGTKVSLYEITGSGSQTWGRIDKGWISMNYVTLGDDGTDVPSDSLEDDATTNEQKPVSGYVVNCDQLNIRAGAGVKYDKIGKFARGTKVAILETKMSGGQLWGRVSKGWVCMDYIELGDKAPSSSGSGSSSTQTKAKSGVVINASEVRLRKTPGTSSKQVGTVKRGDRLVILETTQYGGATWGRTEKGWIHMYYVKLDSKDVPSGSFVRTVTASSLRIRSGPGTSNKEVGKYTKGTQVVILETTKVGSTTWGRTSKGWISLYYVE